MVLELAKAGMDVVAIVVTETAERMVAAEASTATRWG